MNNMLILESGPAGHGMRSLNSRTNCEKRRSKSASFLPLLKEVIVFFIYDDHSTINLFMFFYQGALPSYVLF